MSGRRQISNSFTVNTVDDGADSVTYSLFPSMTQIAVGRTPSGGYTPQTVSLTCGYKKSVGDTLTVVNDSAEKFDGYYIVFRRRNRGSGDWDKDSGNYIYLVYAYISGTASKSLLNSFSTSDYKELEFYIIPDTIVPQYHSGRNFYYVTSVTGYIDKVNVPVVADGDKGNDGNWPQQIFYRSSSSTAPTTPDTSQSDNNMPTGWTAYPQGTTTTYRYEYVSQRTKVAGVWSAYSPPALYSYRASDGTSIQIQGVAISIDPDRMPANPNVGDAVLYNGTGANADSEVWDGSTWNEEDWPAGTGFIYSINGHLYVRTSVNTTRWRDAGQIKGDKGDSAVGYQIIIDSSSAAVNAMGKLNASFQCHVLKSVGTTQTIDATGSMYVNGSQCGEDGNYYDDDGMFDDIAWTGITQLVLEYRVNNTAVATASIPITIQGKMSRNLWFAGWYEDLEGTTFDANDVGAPYVQTDTVSGVPKCYAYKGENGTGIYFPSSLAGYKNNENWGIMESNFEYLITKAIFAALAKLGYWTFNAHFMYSEVGTRLSDGEQTSQGELRYKGIINDPSEPNQWMPNISMDADNGRASFAKDNIRFEPDGSGWIAGQNITWDEDGNLAMRGFTKKKRTVITDSNFSEYVTSTAFGYYFDFSKCGTFIDFSSNVTTKPSITLPLLHRGLAYTDAQKNDIRSFIGTTVIIYNRSSNNINLLTKITPNSTYSTYVAPNHCMELECKLGKDTNDQQYELVYWEEINDARIA